MTQKKINNIRQIWKKEGYALEINKVRRLNGEVMEVEMSIKDKDGNQPMFSSHWKIMKKLAGRQNFLVMPVNEGDGTIVLLHALLINGVEEKLNTIHRLHLDTYWFTQGLTETKKFSLRLTKHAVAIERLRKQLQKMGNCHYSTQIVLQSEVFWKFVEFRNSLKGLSKDMEDSGLLTAEHLQWQKELSEAYYKAD